MNDSGECEKCPSNCLKCGMSLFDKNNVPIIIDDIPKQDLDNGLYDVKNSFFVCTECSTSYMVSADMQSCEKCGLDCFNCANGKFKDLFLVQVKYLIIVFILFYFYKKKFLGDY